MHVTWTFTGDGILAFLGGASALVAVWLSNRQSVRNLQRQMDTEKHARDEELEARKRSVATAILFEIDNFYSHHLSDREDLYDRWEKAKVHPNAVERFAVLAGESFAVYTASAHMLGDLGGKTARAVVKCYAALSTHIDLLRKYEGMLTGPPEEQNLMKGVFQNAVRKSGESAVILAIEACQQLSEAANESFSVLAIAQDGIMPIRDKGHTASPSGTESKGAA